MTFVIILYWVEMMKKIKNETKIKKRRFYIIMGKTNNTKISGISGLDDPNAGPCKDCYGCVVV